MYQHFLLGQIPVAARSAAARLLGSWFRIPPGAWMFVVSVCVVQVEVSVKGRSLVQRSPTDCGVCMSVIKCKETTSTPTASR
jgi:hypothetical protein